MSARFATLRAAALLLPLLASPLAAHAEPTHKPPAPTHAAAAATRPAAQAPAQPVHINSATAAELVGLPGVGPSRAQAIVELRKKLGGFKKVEDLMRVKGIGRKTFRKLEPMIRL